MFCDLDWIQTSNLLSRNQVRYSIAPRGHFEFANVKINNELRIINHIFFEGLNLKFKI